MNTKAIAVTIAVVLGAQVLNYLALKLYLPDASSAALFTLCLAITLAEFTGLKLCDAAGLDAIATSAIAILCLTLLLDTLATWTQVHHHVITEVGTKILIGANTSAGGMIVLMAIGGKNFGKT